MSTHNGTDARRDRRSGAFAIINDILIAGRDIEHHEQILKQVIKSATEYNLKFYFDKCYVRRSSVPYIGSHNNGWRATS